MKPKTIESQLPSWMRVWWNWNAIGFAAWNRDVWIVIGWFIVLVALAAAAPIALLGIGCRRLVARVRRRERETFRQSPSSVTMGGAIRGWIVAHVAK